MLPVCQILTIFTAHVGYYTLTPQTQSPMFAALDGMLRSGRGRACRYAALLSP